MTHDLRPGTQAGQANALGFTTVLAEAGAEPRAAGDRSQLGCRPGSRPAEHQFVVPVRARPMAPVTPATGHA
ncbi:hypothetical protein M2271_006398 [Streptomyces sp. LBL]|uniref:hypothetical protein n=1 Tax=Streptomyces sp. LBL TaxID=2940562 RepID=UPI0024741D38|nr:hypothetical protein [Streptomyces sp. LBL]MDH6628565.1 hypothetical protein [Streptomyces sp. LBL]